MLNIFQYIQTYPSHDRNRNFDNILYVSISIELEIHIADNKHETTFQHEIHRCPLVLQ